MSEKIMKPIVETYNEEEEFLYSKTYLFCKGYAHGMYLPYFLKALPLARRLHNGQYRKGEVTLKDGSKHKLPYILHPLKVCSTLISLNLPLSREDWDILLTAGVLHDAIEDSSEYFPKGGIELVQDYGFPQRVYEIIKKLSKHQGCNEYELNEYFNNIKTDPLALLIKLADRSHNVEDLYVMSIPKLHKYTLETSKWIYPLCSYGKANYPDLSNGITVLKAKIVSLTELTETVVDKYEQELSEKDKVIAEKEALISKLEEELAKYKNNR